MKLTELSIEENGIEYKYKWKFDGTSRSWKLVVKEEVGEYVPRFIKYMNELCSYKPVFNQCTELSLKGGFTCQLRK